MLLVHPAILLERTSSPSHVPGSHYGQYRHTKIKRDNTGYDPPCSIKLPVWLPHFHNQVSFCSKFPDRLMPNQGRYSPAKNSSPRVHPPPEATEIHSSKQNGPGNRLQMAYFMPVAETPFCYAGHTAAKQEVDHRRMRDRKASKSYPMPIVSFNDYLSGEAIPGHQVLSSVFRSILRQGITWLHPCLFCLSLGHFLIPFLVLSLCQIIAAHPFGAWSSDPTKFSAGPPRR